jgi:hypothetical protein
MKALPGPPRARPAGAAAGGAVAGAPERVVPQWALWGQLRAYGGAPRW